MDYDQQISKINNEIIEVKTKIKKVNEKRTNAIISRNNQLWKEVIKDESSIIIAILNKINRCYRTIVDNNPCCVPV